MIPRPESGRPTSRAGRPTPPSSPRWRAGGRSGIGSSPSMPVRNLPTAAPLPPIGAHPPKLPEADQPPVYKPSLDRTQAAKLITGSPLEANTGKTPLHSESARRAGSPHGYPESESLIAEEGYSQPLTPASFRSRPNTLVSRVPVADQGESAEATSQQSSLAVQVSSTDVNVDASTAFEHIDGTRLCNEDQRPGSPEVALAVRLPNGKRVTTYINLSKTVGDALELVLANQSGEM